MGLTVASERRRRHLANVIAIAKHLQTEFRNAAATWQMLL